MKAWKRIEPTVVQKTAFRSIVTKRFILPSGEEADFDTLNGEDWQFAAVIALTKDNKVILAEQFRPGPEQIFDELPGGMVEPDETLETAVKRELSEETGYEAGKMQYLGKNFKDAYVNTPTHYFLATNCEKHGNGQSLDRNEFINVRLVSIDQLFDNAKSGNMSDPNAILLAYDTLLKIKEKSKK